MTNKPTPPTPPSSQGYAFAAGGQGGVGIGAQGGQGGRAFAGAGGVGVAVGGAGGAGGAVFMSAGAGGSASMHSPGRMAGVMTMNNGRQQISKVEMADMSPELQMVFDTAWRCIHCMRGPLEHAVDPQHKRPSQCLFQSTRYLPTGVALAVITQDKDLLNKVIEAAAKQPELFKQLDALQRLP